MELLHRSGHRLDVAEVQVLEFVDQQLEPRAGAARQREGGVERRLPFGARIHQDEDVAECGHHRLLATGPRAEHAPAYRA